MSSSDTHTQGTPTIPNIEVAARPIVYVRNTDVRDTDPNNLSAFNNDWQARSSRSVSPLSDIQTPNSSESKENIPDTVIQVTDDGWRMSTKGSLVEPYFNMTGPSTSPVSQMHAPTDPSFYVENPSAVPTAQWFSHPPLNPIISVCTDACFQHLPPSGIENSLYPPFPPTGPICGPQEFYQAPPPYLGMPVLDNHFHGAMPVAPQTQPMRPSPFLTPTGHCNITYSTGFQTSYSMPPPDPFTDHSFGYEPARNHLVPPQFPIPPSHTNIPSPPNLIYPNSIPMPGIPDSHWVPFDYTSRPSQHFIQMPAPPSNGPPVQQVNAMGSDYILEGSAVPSVANNHSPRHSRHSRKVQARQARMSSSSSPQGRNRIGRQANQLGLSLGARSSVMEEFRSFNKDKQWTLQDIFGHIVEFCGDQSGSRLIQQQLEEASVEDRQRVFDEMVPSNTSQLIHDVFGNYVVQKFFDIGTTSQKDTISQEVENNVNNYSVHIYACRVVQKAFDYMSEEQQDRLIDRLAGNLLACIKDQHGNHVIQKLIDTVAPERITFLRIVSANLPDLAASSSGCRVLQRCLSLPKAHAQPVLDAIDRHCIGLMRDRYGNYVIQFLLQHGDDDDKARILAKILGSVYTLAKNQYASHVCEKAITYSDAQNRSLLIGEILTETEDGHPLPSMIQDEFANYVLQRALEMVEGEQRAALFHQVRAFVTAIRRSSCSKQLFKIERLLDRYFGKIKTSSESGEGRV